MASVATAEEGVNTREPIVPRMPTDPRDDEAWGRWATDVVLYNNEQRRRAGIHRPDEWEE